MPTPTLRRQRTPFNGVPAEVFAELAAFVRRVAPRWVQGSRSLSRLLARRGDRRELARSRRRGYRLVLAPAPTFSSDRVVRRRWR